MHSYGHEYFESVTTEQGLNQLEENSCKLLGFELLILKGGESYSLETRGREFAIVVLTGTVDITVNDQHYEAVGGRASVFAGQPALVYAPCNAQVSIEALADAEVALCSSPSSTPIEPYRVDPEDCATGKWGHFNTSRTYRFAIGQNQPSERLYVAEVIAPGGNWATYPPHKHEVNAPDNGEIYQEEMYYYRLEPGDGIGLCALYGGKVESDYAFVIRNNTILKMPHGYHTLCAAPGYKVWYLAAIAGDTKAARPFTDPAHAWYHKAEDVLDNLEQNLLR